MSQNSSHQFSYHSRVLLCRHAQLTGIPGRPSDIDRDGRETVKHAKGRLHDQAEHDDGVDRGVMLGDVDDRLEHDSSEWDSASRVDLVRGGA